MINHLAMIKQQKKEFISLNQEHGSWTGLCATSSGNIYACKRGDWIFKQSDGSGDFVEQTNIGYTYDWWGICATPSNNIYICDYNGSQGGDIYKQTNESGSFVALNQTTRQWVSLCAMANGDVWAGTVSDVIYKQTNGSGNFSAITALSGVWTGICENPVNGDIYICNQSGNIYMYSGGIWSGALNSVARNWGGLCADPDGNIYASVVNGDIYKQIDGSGDFVAMGQTSRVWQALCSDTAGNIYAAVYNGDIYKLTA